MCIYEPLKTEKQNHNIINSPFNNLFQMMAWSESVVYRNYYH